MRNSSLTPFLGLPLGDLSSRQAPRSQFHLHQLSTPGGGGCSRLSSASRSSWAGPARAPAPVVEVVPYSHWQDPSRLPALGAEGVKAGHPNSMVSDSEGEQLLEESSYYYYKEVVSVVQTTPKPNEQAEIHCR